MIGKFKEDVLLKMKLMAKIQESPKKRDFSMVFWTLLSPKELIEKNAGWWNSSEENTRFLFCDF